MKTMGLFFLIILSLGLRSCSDENSMADMQNQTVRVNAIPATAKIIFHINNLIYTMDENGENMAQVTFDNSYTFEHVALSHDRTKIVANYFSDLSIGGQSSKMLLYDLSAKTLTHLLPDFTMAGNGGVDWDSEGYIYFAAVSELVFPNPVTTEEFQANAGANDIYRMKFDGTDIQNLTNTENLGEADVSVSPDNQFISYNASVITDPNNTFLEIWKRNVNGNDPQRLFIGGPDRVSSVHDPEISPDGNYVVFSRVNSTVPPVFPDNPLANTAHDIIKVNLNNADLTAITQPGPISIAPDWKGNKILFLEITDKTNPPHAGLATINADGTDYKLIKEGTNIGKWIPE